jgi:hypothetical protein
MATERDTALLRESDVTQQYRLSGAWLRKSRKLMLGPPFIRVGRMIFYRREDLENFVRAHKIEPTGEKRVS